MQEQDMFDFKPSPPKPGREYPIGGYAPGNYICNCATCKKKFIGDKRAVQCEPCAEKMIEASGGKDYTHIHVNLPSGGIATISPNASPELLGALDKMVKLAKEMPAPGEQKSEIPEEIMEKILRLALHEAALHFSPIYNPDQNTACVICYTNGAREFYLTMQEEMEQVIENAYAFNRLSVEQANEIVSLKEEIQGYKEMHEDHKRLVRGIDVIINGEEGAAKQASLCDLVGQIQKLAENKTPKLDDINVPDLPRTSIDQRFAKDFFLKVSVSSDLLPENYPNLRATISKAMIAAVYQELGRLRNTGVVIEEFNPEIK